MVEQLFASMSSHQPVLAIADIWQPKSKDRKTSTSLSPPAAQRQSGEFAVCPTRVFVLGRALGTTDHT